jgi:hypothetical protein
VIPKPKSPISKNSFLFACTICENDNPSITHRVATHFADEMNDLFALNAFATDSLNYCLNKNGEAEDLYFENQLPGYFDNDNNFIGVPFESFTKYRLNLDWIIKNISDDFGLCFTQHCEEIVPNLLWQIGFVKFDLEIPIFFARKIKTQDCFDKINKALEGRKSSVEGIILTSSNDIPSYFHSKIADHKVIPIKNCLSADKKNFHIDKNILKSAFSKSGKDGFSNGYRSAFFDGDYFRFTKQEADVLEFLYKSGKPIHKDEIMAEVTENSTEIKTLFRNPDAKNIRKNILQNDKKGYYWLNL